jgi:two-component system cell cycle sensor histidine kinase/response regulator CckA
MTSPEPLEPLERQPRGSPYRDAVIAEVLLQATDASCDAWVVFEAIRDETGELDDLRVLHGNPAYWELSGLAPTTALGHGIAELIPGLDWSEGLANRLFQVMAAGRSLEDKGIRTTPQAGPLAGQARLFDVNFTVANDVLAAGFRDVTERRAETDKLATSLARFEALFEQAPVAMVTVGADRAIRLNQAAVELYGRGSDEMVRLSFSQGSPWIPPDQVELWAEMRRAVAAGERVSGIRFALVRPDGERRELEGSSIPIVTGHGVPDGVVTVLTDLTDQLSLEVQFRHAQKMEALGRLAGGIAHDFNNLLMGIQGFGEMLARDARRGRASPDHADQVVVAARRAIDVTARLTAFSRREVATREAVEMARLVERVLPLINQVAPESIDVVTHLEGGPIVMLDASEFEQVLINLVVNAVDAMPDGGRLTIEVSTVQLDRDHAASHLGEAEGEHVLVAVSDTGIGMDEETRSRIFEPFFTTKPVGEGTGLGLAMAFGTVERAGGRIWVYSEPGHGTTLKIYLPSAKPGVAIAADEPHVGTPIAGGSESILLLEDDALVRELLLTVLRGVGYEVIVASRPSEAFAFAAGRRFDLMVSDVVMPEMMGNAVAARIRLTQPDLWVVFMSGYTARALDFTLGPQDVLVNKPLAPSEVARTVREALDRSAAPAT